MMSSIKTIVILWFVLSTAGIASAVVVLKSGERIEAKAYLEGGLVYVTLPDGRMQAYDPEEIDLEASGLAPKVETKNPEKGRKTIAALGGQKLDTTPSVKTPAVVTITDADVVHIAPGESPVNGEGASDEPALVVSRIRKQRSGNLLKITGLVTNAGSATVDTIMVSASAVDDEGKSCGQRRGGVPGQLKPGQNAEFTIELAVNREFADLKVEARGKEVHPIKEDS